MGHQRLMRRVGVFATVHTQIEADSRGHWSQTVCVNDPRDVIPFEVHDTSLNSTPTLPENIYSWPLSPYDPE
jgi:hypothetical protein